jgi:hypothetical protein
VGGEWNDADVGAWGLWWTERTCVQEQAGTAEKQNEAHCRTIHNLLYLDVAELHCFRAWGRRKGGGEVASVGAGAAT